MLPKDPMMLLSFVNMKLRDDYDSLDDMCDKLDEDKNAIIEALKSIGYRYNETQNQFK